MKIHVDALGCKLNQSEMEDLARQFHAAGHEIVTDPTQAELSIFNTCTVTHVAARKSRQALRRLRRENPDACIVATGCYVQMSPAEIEALESVDVLVDNQAKGRIFDLLAARIPGLLAIEEEATDRHLSPLTPATHTRAFIKIQEGCNNACTYCIVTKARGPATSRPQDDILEEIRQRLQEGYKEIVLTGVHIGCYGQDLEGIDLAQLVTAILEETMVTRLRLSSIEPWDFTDALLDCWTDPRLCRHLHLPLQSGCDATLDRMERKYTTAQYADLLSKIRAAIPGVAISTDIMVGFPQETEAEFESSLAFVKRQGFSRLHVFKYSQREDTAAAGMSGHVPPPIKDARSQAMRRIGRLASRQFRESLLGSTMDVLWETTSSAEENAKPVWSGLTDNYARIYAASKRPLANEITQARLVRLTKGGIWATLPQNAPVREPCSARANT